MTLQELLIENKLMELEVYHNPKIQDYLELYRVILNYNGERKQKYMERIYEIKEKIRKEIR